MLRASLLVWMLGLMACAGATDRYARALPDYVAPDAELFDDSIEPHAAGLDFDAYRPAQDPQFRARALGADGIVRVRLSTLDEAASLEGPRYSLRLVPLEKVGGAHAPAAPFEVAVSPDSETLGLLRHGEARLLGTVFLAFTKDFRRPGWPAETHVHLAPDTPAVHKALADVLALDTLQR